MEKQFYSIGEFASMNQVSTRMLRHYDKIDLLHPAGILPNGYRCYSDEQIESISQIRRLRGCGFLLEEIGEILQQNSAEFLAKNIKSKFVELQTQAAEQQAALQSLNELAREHDSAAPFSTYGISVTVRSAANLVLLNQPISLDDVEDAFDKLFGLLPRKKSSVIGCSVLLNRLDNQGDDQSRVGVSISETVRDERCDMLSLPAAHAISVIHYGDYYNIGHAYRALFAYAKQHDFSLGDTCMERYLIDRSHGVSPAEYVTELSVVLKNTP